MSEEPDPMPTGFPWDGEEWTVCVLQVGDYFHVNPRQGLIIMDNWFLDGPWWQYPWRFCLYHRRQYPKSEKALRKALRDCQRCCDLTNEAEREAAAVLKRVKP